MNSSARSSRGEVLNSEDYDKILRPALGAYNLPPSLFHDSAVYERELDRIFHQQWFCVGRVEDVDAEGGEAIRVVDTEEIRVSRTVDGELACEHRIEEWHGFLFVNFDHEAPSVADQLSECNKWGVENYAMSDETSVHRFEWNCAANWKLLVENFVEEYHVAWVHADSFHPTMPMQRWATFPEMTQQPWTYMFGDFHETSMGTEGPALFPIIPSLTDRERGGMGIVTIYPNLMLILAVDCLIYYYVLPAGVSSTKVVAHFCLPSDVSARIRSNDPELRAPFNEYVENTQMILDEDMLASDRQSVGLRSRFAQAGRLSRHELLLSTFHHWLVATAYDEEDPETAPDSA